ncbi:MAG TPA: DUF4124 domain-containing protein [Burkholderiales bacterium]|nr:DUF4124 domain-containing protein [Burkholderiales bacterium]
MTRSLCVFSAVLTFALAGSASAQVYKWVDARGITNYSNSPPIATAGVAIVGSAAPTLSSYAPDPSLIQAVGRFRASSDKVAAEIETAADKLQAARLAAAQTASAARAQYATCIDSRRVDCDQTESDFDGPIGISLMRFLPAAYGSPMGFDSRGFAGVGRRGAASYGSRAQAPVASGPMRAGVSIR